jgi:hypothetical protein
VTGEEGELVRLRVKTILIGAGDGHCFFWSSMYRFTVSSEIWPIVSM